MQAGRFLTVTGADMGAHKGLNRYTLGQGAKIDGAAAKYFVVDKCVDSGLVIVAERGHPSLYSKNCSVAPGKFSWVSGTPPTRDSREGPVRFQCQFRVRHRQPLCRGVTKTLATSTLTAPAASRVITCPGI